MQLVIVYVDRPPTAPSCSDQSSRRPAESRVSAVPGLRAPAADAVSRSVRVYRDPAGQSVGLGARLRLRHVPLQHREGADTRRRRQGR